MKNTNKKIKTTSGELEKAEQAAVRKPGDRRRENLSAAELPLLFLVPLVETAWAHGAIAAGERRLIFTAAREEQIDETHFLNDTLAELLVYQPSQRFFDECRSQIKTELEAMTVKERETKLRKLVSRCRRIAAEAGGNSAMDVEKFTSAEEREMLARLVSELNFREDKNPGEKNVPMPTSSSRAT